MADLANNSTDTGADKPAGLKSAYSSLSPGITKTLTQGTLLPFGFHKDQQRRCCLGSLLTGKRLCVSLHSYTELERNSQLGAGAFQSPTDTQKGLRTRDKQHCTYRTKTKTSVGLRAPFLSGDNTALPLLPFLEEKKKRKPQTKQKLKSDPLASKSTAKWMLTS